MCEVGKNVYVCFIDYEKAFDRVDNEKMIECLKNIGTSKRDLKLVVNLYWSQRVVIQLERSISDKIEKRDVPDKAVFHHRVYLIFTLKIYLNTSATLEALTSADAALTT